MAGLLWDGIDARVEADDREYAKKRNTMRGSLQGLFVDMQTLVGPCPRATASGYSLGYDVDAKRSLRTTIARALGPGGGTTMRG